MMDVVPDGWVLATLGDIAEWGSGGTPSRKKASYYDGDIPWVKTGDLGPRIVSNASESISDEGLRNSSAKMFPKGAVAIAMYGATIGKTSILGIEAATNQACAVGKPIDDITTSDFLYYLLLNEKERFIAKGKGGAQPNISQAVIKSHEIVLPPYAEQTRIAQKLDQLLTQVDALNARVDAVPDILKRFRQSVLAAAVSGKLTEEWRENNGIDFAWNKVKVGDIVERIEAGKNIKCIEVPPKSDQVGIIKISAVTWGEYDEEESKTLPDKALFLEARRVMPGDFLISRANTIELLGNPVIVRKTSKNLMLSDKVLRLVMADDEKPWLSIFLRSHEGRRQIESRSTGNQQSMRNIGQKALLDIDMPNPSSEEKKEIVFRVDRLFSLADNIEDLAGSALVRINSLTQSILAKAFRGELVPQDTNDEPACQLLGKIKSVDSRRRKL